MSRDMRPVFSALVLAVLVAPPLLAATSETGQSHPVLDLRLPPDGTIQQLTLVDGSRIYGRIESVTDIEVSFRSVAGLILTVPRDRVHDLRPVEGEVVEGEFRPADPHNTRLFFAPTARALHRGEGSFGTFEVLFPFVQIGVTDRFSIGGGTPLVFAGDFHPVWITPKLQVVTRDRVQAAVGVLHVVGTGGHDAGIAYGVTTFGGGEHAGTVGVGYAYSGNERTTILLLGGEARATRHIKWITENWVFPGSGDGLVSGGVRFIGDRVSADLGVMLPLVGDAVLVPLVSFAWKF